MNKLKNLVYWIPVFGIMLPSCTMDKFKNPRPFGIYQMICCLIALMLLMGSCMSEEEKKRLEREQVEREANKQKPIVDYDNTPRGISVQTIDGCQYVYAETSGGVAITHKANCSNPFHSQ